MKWWRRGRARRRAYRGIYPSREVKAAAFGEHYGARQKDTGTYVTITPENASLLLQGFFGPAVAPPKPWYRRLRWPVGCEIETVGLGGRIYARHWYWRSPLTPRLYVHVFKPPTSERRMP